MFCGLLSDYLLAGLGFLKETIPTGNGFFQKPKPGLVYWNKSKKSLRRDKPILIDIFFP